MKNDGQSSVVLGFRGQSCGGPDRACATKGPGPGGMECRKGFVPRRAGNSPNRGVHSLVCNGHCGGGLLTLLGAQAAMAPFAERTYGLCICVCTSARLHLRTVSY